MNKKVVGTSILGLALAGLAAVPASADPVGSPVYRPLAGMGSATTAQVMNALSDVVLYNGSKVLGSYDPTPAGALVQTKDPAASPGCNIPRADGSGAGRNALTAATTPGDPTFGCLDFARSSSTTVNAGQTFIQMASDGLTYAFPTSGKIGPKATLTTLQAIYKCTAPAGAFTALIPQAGSGTRNDWAALMGIPAATLPACVKDTTAAGVPIQEHDGTVLQANNAVVPFSVAQWIAQSSGQIVDTRSGAQIGNIGGVPVLSQNPNQAKFRAVGNILPSAVAADTTSAAYYVFVNDGSGKPALCQQGAATIQKFGFAPSC